MSPEKQRIENEERRACVVARALQTRQALVELRPEEAVRLSGDLVNWIDPSVPWERIERGKLELWTAILQDSYRPTEAAAFKTLLEDARMHGESSHVVELTALAALGDAELGRLKAATRQARIASRMARSEDLPQPAALANLILARVRRLGGSPYLAARIASALRRFAPPSFRRWLDWELVLATGISTPLPRDVDGPASVLHEALRSCPTASSEWVAEELRRLEQHECALVSADVRRLRPALLPAAIEQSEDLALREWAAGASDDVPHGLSGMCPAIHGSQSPVAAVISGSLRSRRVLSLGAETVRGEGVSRLPVDAHAQHRTLAVLAALALAGKEGLEEGALFSRVYGFAYKAELHRGTFNTVLHRARAALGRAGSLVREHGRVRLLHTGTLVIPDPRCHLGTRDQVLRWLATTRGCSARQIADELQLPLRSIQALLRELVDEGTCQAARDGRRVAYVIEDTTFQEPTRIGPNQAPERQR